MSRTSKVMRVTITKEIRVEIDDAHLTPEALAEFSASIYKVDRPIDLFECAAQQIARFEPSFVEGIGTAVPYYSHTKDTAAVVWTEVDEEVEVEEVRARPGAATPKGGEA